MAGRDFASEDELTLQQLREAKRREKNSAASADGSSSVARAGHDAASIGAGSTGASSNYPLFSYESRLEKLQADIRNLQDTLSTASSTYEASDVGSAASPRIKELAQPKKRTGNVHTQPPLDERLKAVREVPEQNKGGELYKRGKALEEKRARMAEQLQRQKMDEELAECTHKPQINSAQKDRRRHADFATYAYAWNESREKKIEDQRKEVEKEEKAGAKPKVAISPASQKILKKLPYVSPVTCWDKHFVHFVKKKEEPAATERFQPRINETSQDIHFQQPAHERLHALAAERKAKLAQAQKDFANMDTAQRKSRGGKVRASRYLHENLYYDGVEKLQRRMATENSFEMTNEPEHIPKISEKSKKIAEEKLVRGNVVDRLYSGSKVPQDQQSTDSVAGSLSRQSDTDSNKELMERSFVKPSAIKGSIPQEFHSFMHRLNCRNKESERWRNEQENSREKKLKKDCTFTPKISKKTRELTQTFSVDGSGPFYGTMTGNQKFNALYDRFLTIQKLREEELERKRQEREDSKLDGCTFRPKISQFKPKKTPKARGEGEEDKAGTGTEETQTEESLHSASQMKINPSFVDDDFAVVEQFLLENAAHLHDDPGFNELLQTYLNEVDALDRTLNTTVPAPEKKAKSKGKPTQQSTGKGSGARRGRAEVEDTRPRWDGTTSPIKVRKAVSPPPHYEKAMQYPPEESPRFMHRTEVTKVYEPPPPQEESQPRPAKKVLKSPPTALEQRVQERARLREIAESRIAAADEEKTYSNLKRKTAQVVSATHRPKATPGRSENATPRSYSRPLKEPQRQEAPPKKSSPQRKAGSSHAQVISDLEGYDQYLSSVVRQAWSGAVTQFKETSDDVSSVRSPTINNDGTTTIEDDYTEGSLSMADLASARKRFIEMHKEFTGPQSGPPVTPFSVADASPIAMDSHSVVTNGTASSSNNADGNKKPEGGSSRQEALRLAASLLEDLKASTEEGEDYTESSIFNDETIESDMIDLLARLNKQDTEGSVSEDLFSGSAKKTTNPDTLKTGVRFGGGSLAAGLQPDTVLTERDLDSDEEEALLDEEISDAGGGASFATYLNAQK